MGDAAWIYPDELGTDFSHGTYDITAPAGGSAELGHGASEEALEPG